MYTGFVDGYIAYLASGRLNDPTCAGRPWAHPITVADMFPRSLQFVTEASSGQFITAEADATSPTPGAVGTAAKARLESRDRREIIGQVVRLVVATPGIWTWRYPLGNIGGANVGALNPTLLPDDLQAALNGPVIAPSRR